MRERKEVLKIFATLRYFIKNVCVVSFTRLFVIFKELLYLQFYL